MACVICVIDNNHEQLLPHFLRHYTERGVRRFILGVRRGSDNPAWQYIQSLNNPNIVLEKTELPPHAINGIVDSKFINDIKTREADWYIPADLDEFHAVADLTFPQLEQVCAQDGADYVASTMRDCVAANGDIPARILAEPDIFEQFPIVSDITAAVMGGCVKKVCFAHPNVDVGPGHHFVLDKSKKPLTSPGLTFHFKWFGDLLIRERQKYEARTHQNSEWHKQQQRLFEHLDANNGKLLSAKNYVLRASRY